MSNDNTKVVAEQVLEVLKSLGIQQNTAQKNTPASTTLSAPTLQGPFQGSDTQFGIFSSPGVRPDRFSTLVRPQSMTSAIISMGGMNPSEYENEIIEIMTGVTDNDSFTNATGFCGDPPEAGQAKVMQRVFTFGDVYAKTKLNALAQTGRLKNRADVPGSILNLPPRENMFLPELMFSLPDTQSQLRYELFTLGANLERSIEKVIWNGDPTASSVDTEFSFIKEFLGLDSQIKDGYTDEVSGVETPSADSVVITFGASVGATEATNGRNIVIAISDLVFSRTDTAGKQGLPGAQWAFVMRPELFRKLVEVYACNYNTYRCDEGTAGNPFNQDSAAVNAFRLEMLNGRYLEVDGTPYPVILSEGIEQTTTAANTYESDMYFVPMSWQGVPLLRLEYFNMGNPYANELSNFLPGTERAVMNNGLFLVGKESTALCDEFHFQSRMRLILETPFLAGRIDNISYSYPNLPAMAYPGASGYVDGGATFRS